MECGVVGAGIAVDLGCAVVVEDGDEVRDVVVVVARGAARRLGCEQIGVVADIVVRAGEGLESVESALVGGVGGDVVVEEEFAGCDGGEDVVGGGLVLCVTELLVGFGRVLFRLWSVVAWVCER